MLICNESLQILKRAPDEIVTKLVTISILRDDREIAILVNATLLSFAMAEKKIGRFYLCGSVN